MLSWNGRELIVHDLHFYTFRFRLAADAESSAKLLTISLGTNCRLKSLQRLTMNCSKLAPDLHKLRQWIIANIVINEYWKLDHNNPLQLGILYVHVNLWFIFVVQITIDENQLYILQHFSVRWILAGVQFRANFGKVHRGLDHFVVVGNLLPAHRSQEWPCILVLCHLVQQLDYGNVVEQKVVVDATASSAAQSLVGGRRRFSLSPWWASLFCSVCSRRFRQRIVLAVRFV